VVRHQMHRVPMYTYCTNHEDICGIMAVRILEIIALLVHWIPYIGGICVVYYLGPILWSLMWGLSRSSPAQPVITPTPMESRKLD
jgi:hypothetical protein